MAKARKPKPSTKRERELEAIYAEIPRMKRCSGKCAVACGPIAMFKGEWDRLRPRLSSTRTRTGLAGPMTCPALSPTGSCTAYTVRPYICRLWGTTETLRCPEGCEPERWLSPEEAKSIFNRICEVAGPETAGTLGSIDDLWAGFALDDRQRRQDLIDRIKKVIQSNNDARSTP